MMRKIVLLFTVILFMCYLYNPAIAQQNDEIYQQDGQFLRGEKYTQFNVSSINADFYVSPGALQGP